MIREESNHPRFFSQSPIRALEPIRRMRGGTQSHLMRCEDEHYYVVKSPCNPQGPKTLVNELLTSLIGIELGLPVARPALVRLSDRLIEVTDELYFQAPTRDGVTRQRKWKGGLCYGSALPENPHAVTFLDFLPKEILGDIELPNVFMAALVLDIWLANADSRQFIFYRKGIGLPYQAVLIDHGLCLGGTGWQYQSNHKCCLYCPSLVYKLVYSIDDFEPWLGQVESFPRKTLESFVHMVPAEWIGKDCGVLETLVSYIFNRRTKVREVLTATAKKMPHIFPNWVPRPMAKETG